MAASTDWQPRDDLSETVRALLTVDPNPYARLTPSASGSPEARTLLEALTPDRLFTAPVRSRDDARAALSGLWLYHDFLDESHRISQDLHSVTGSLWHAIMHRREGDFSNSKYWYARCHRHPTFAGIAEAGRAALRRAGVAKAGELERLVQNEWTPDGFVDVVEAVHRKPTDPLYAAAVELQRAEWRVLFEHCVAAAVKS